MKPTTKTTKIPIGRHVPMVAIAVFFTSPIEANEPKPEPITIVAFGDSTTATRGPLNIYAQILAETLPQNRIPATVINAGIGGNTTEMARQRFAKDVLAKKPDWAVLQFGINDAAIDVWKGQTQPRVTRKRYEDNLRHFVQKLKSQSANVILMTPNPLRWTDKLKAMYGKPPYDPTDPDGFNVLLKTYAAAVRRIAKEENVPLIDVYAEFEAFDRKEGKHMEDLLLDGMHPNDQGHAKVAEWLIEKIVEIEKNGGTSKP